MALSGSYDYTVTAADIITSSLEDIQCIQNGETIDNADYATALRELNLMTKEWMGKPGYAPGLKRWTRKIGYLFMRKNKNIYSLGPITQGGDYCCVTNYTQGSLTALGSSGASFITVGVMNASPTFTTATTPAASDYIGIVLDSGDIQWTTVSSIAALPGVINLSATLTGNASLGNAVYSFAVTGQTSLPLDALTVVRRDINSIDYQMDKMGDIYEYEQIANKNITSTPTQWFYAQGLSLGSMYINCVPAVITNLLRMTLLYPIDDLDSVANTMAFPQQWYGGLARSLGKRLAPKFGKAWSQTMEENLNTSMLSASNVDPDTTYQYFQPGRE